MPVYEFECPTGHVTEDLVPMGSTQWPCNACFEEMIARGHGLVYDPARHLAKRIMSATKTDFHFADTRK